MHEWIGLGPSAASQHAGWRGANVSDLSGWLEHLAAGRRMTEDRVALSPVQLLEDALIFGLRMNAGVDLTVWRTRCPEAPWAGIEAVVQRLAEGGLAIADGDRVRLTTRGRLLADSVGLEVMEAFHHEPAHA
jgi:oxygen-independent coproporphyrinogen-3 oxidase